MVSVETQTGSIRKDGIYSIARNATEFIHFWMNRRRSVHHLIGIAIRTSVCENAKRRFKYESWMFR